MPAFNHLFFEPIKIELSEAEKLQLESVLNEIYKGAPIHYERPSDFEQCKTQLLALLDHITALDPSKLALFGRYRENVSKLLDTSSILDIEVTLKAAKQSIESSLLAIIKKHDKIDKTALDSLVVNLCYTGAFSSIEYALDYFHVDSLALYIENIKSQLLLEFSQQFLLEQNLVECIGNDTHYANGLYNIFASTYGAKLKKDPFSYQFTRDIRDKFSTYLQTNFTVTAFMQFSTIYFPMPPSVEIENGEQLTKLTEFFQIFEKEGLVQEKYLRLYDEIYKDDINMTLNPKAPFKLYFMALLATYLQEKGYLNDLYIKVLEQNFLYTGDALVGINDNGSYRILSDEELLSSQMIPILDSLSLWSQLTAETLLKLYQESNNEQYFTALLTKPLLPRFILESLIEIVTSNKELRVEAPQLADYIFNNSHYELTLEQLNSLANAVTEKKKRPYLIELVKSDKVNYVRSLLSQHPELLVNITHPLGSLAAVSGAANVISLLHEFGVPLDEKNFEGLTPAHAAAANGQIAVLEKFHELHIPLDMGDNHGLTLAHAAVQYGQLAVLEKLHELGVPLDTRDNKGLTSAHHAAQFGHATALEKLHQLGVPLNTANDAGLTPAYTAAQHEQLAVLEKLHQLKVPLDVSDNQGFTLVHEAAQNGRLAVLEKLHELGVPLETRDNNGLTPAHHAAEFGKWIRKPLSGDW